MSQDPTNRREFLKQTAAAAVLTAGTAVAQQVKPQQPGPNETIRLGVIGVGGQGQFDLRLFLKDPGVRVPVICDVNRLHADEANQKILDGKADIVVDYQRILERKDIDAVLIATPEHWHAIQMIHACQANKDVYSEKPTSHNIVEGRRMVQAASKYKRIVQIGIQQQSGPHYIEAAHLIQEGKLGKVVHVRTWNMVNAQRGLGPCPEETAPATLDWDRYLGPAPLMPYCRVKAEGSFRCFWAFAGGTLTDWGNHHMATIHHLMGANKPSSAVAAGGKLAMKDISETPDTLNVLWEYPGWTLEYVLNQINKYSPDRNDYGQVFYGTSAALYIDRSGYEIYPDGEPGKALSFGKPRVDTFMPAALSDIHIRNFLDCVRSRKQPNATVEIGHRASTVCHLGNISLHTGHKIRWDAENEVIIGDPEASKLLTREYRPPYVLPEV